MAKTQTSQSLRRGTPARPDETENAPKARGDKPIPKEEPAKTYVVNSEGTAAPSSGETRAEKTAGIETADVRIGPGDVGEERTPHVVDRQPRLHTSRAMSGIVVAALIAVGLLVIIWIFA